MSVKIYQSHELSNEEYQALPQVSGSDLVSVINDCPAMWKYGERKETKALFDGTASHALILEPEEFEKNYFRDINPEEYPGALKTNSDLSSWLKGRGIKGYSGKTKPELIKMIADTGESPQILSDISLKHQEKNNGKTPVVHSDYDRMMAMRAQLFRDPKIKDILTGATTELSIVTSTRKCRIDIATSGKPEIWDYKTSTTAHPEKFGLKAHDLGYWIKMAWQADIFKEAYGIEPCSVGFIVQDKNKPYIPQCYRMTKEQLSVGLDQAILAEKLLTSCLESGKFPAYGGGVQELHTPGFIGKRYGIDG